MSLKLFPDDMNQMQQELLAGEGNDHDWPMLLANHGDINSVPAMIAVLKRNPAYSDGGPICTRSHCLDALQQLTKADPGNKNEDWENWWQEHNNKKDQ